MISRGGAVNKHRPQLAPWPGGEMSTSQPPGGPPEGGYAQPQDPWAGGYEPGLASVPTDPIPQQYDPYSSVPPGEIWSQATAIQGGPYGYVPQQPPPAR